MERKIALFDFDGTLTRHDTLITFAIHAVGKWRFMRALVLSFPWIIGWKCKLLSNSRAKERLFKCLYKGMALIDFDAKAADFVNIVNLDLSPEGMRLLRYHQCAGNKIYIVSASIDRWIIPWATAHGIKNVIATKPEIDVATGKLTGHFLTPNCHGIEKVYRIRKAIPLIDHYEVWAYGDSSGDDAMLDLATHPHKL